MRMTRKSLLASSPILQIALPGIAGNLAVPLLGWADTAIVGHLGATHYIAAIAVGSLLFNLLYWLCGFLRTGTGGLTAQACGARRPDECLRTLLRALALSGGLSLLILLFQQPLCEAILTQVAPAAAVRAEAVRYFDILVWGAPAVLALYALSGWFLGMQNSRHVMIIALVQNAVNIPVSLVLVFGCGMQVTGVALGTLTAQYAALAVAGGLLWGKYRHLLRREYVRGWRQRTAIARLLSINADIFLRTLCLIAVTYWFTACGTRLGTVTLSANALLMQFFLLFSYVMDGFAFAGEALGGRYRGAGDLQALRRMVRALFAWGTATAILFALTYAIGGKGLLRLLTDDVAVLHEAARYLPYLMVMPLVAYAAFLWDGLFIGLTATRAMLLTMLPATAVFLYATAPGSPFPATGATLWTAFLAYLLLRGAGLTLCYRRKLRSAPSR